MASEHFASGARAAAFQGWLRNASAGPDPFEPQRPEHELLAEHHMMGLAVSAMEVEAKRLLHGSALRADFWQSAVDFIGNFTHLVHRVKEEEVFFPALQDRGLLTPDYAEHFEEDHKALGELTNELCTGVGEGDWEKAFRVVSIYGGRIRPHLEAEERSLLSPELAGIPESELVPVQKRFHEIESDVLGAEGRGRILRLTEELRRSVGLAEHHAVVDAW